MVYFGFKLIFELFYFLLKEGSSEIPERFYSLITLGKSFVVLGKFVVVGISERSLLKESKEYLNYSSVCTYLDSVESYLF